MTNTESENIKAQVNGERNAASGYTKQYCEFARRVYACLRNSTLERIRVADAAKRVDILDDIYYETAEEIHAYQLKTSNTDRAFGYAEFKKIFPGIVNGWKKIHTDHPTKKVIPYLWTDRKCSDGSPIIEGDHEIGKFPEFIEKVLKRKQEGKRIDKKWQSTVGKLQQDVQDEKKIKLSKKDWALFWESFDFATSKELEPLEIEYAKAIIKTADLIDLKEVIEETASNGEGVIELTSEQIIQKLGIKHRLKPSNNHALEVDDAYYVPNNSVLDAMNAQLKSKEKGYIFVEGTPGSGKSTMLTKWAQSIPNPCIRYYAFDFTHPSHPTENSSTRGEGLTFLFDLVKALIANGYETKDETIPYPEETILKEQLRELLQSISESYKRTHVQTIIIIDGLDHVHREYTKIQGVSLLKELPSTDELPEGVVIVLGSQYYEELGLDEYILERYRRQDSIVKMPAFGDDEVRSMAIKALGNERVSDKMVKALQQKSSGHPLYLHYILKQLSENPSMQMDEIPNYETDIEIYYNRLVGTLSNEPTNRNFLGLLARVNGDIRDEFVRKWDVPEKALVEILKKMGHLFSHNRNSQTRTFFHNSFRQYLLKITSYDYIAEEYSREIDRDYYQQLANYARASETYDIWDLGYYLYQGEDDDAFIREITLDGLLEQLYQFRPLERVKQDVEYAAQIAARRQDAYMMARILLLRRQLSQMETYDFNGLAIINELLTLGEGNIAKSQLHDGQKLQCTKIGALYYARMFHARGDKREARFLFEAATPIIRMETYKGDYRIKQEIEDYFEEISEWAQTAVYFIGLEDIEVKIKIYTAQLVQFAEANGRQLNKEEILRELRYHIAQSLIEMERYVEMESYIQVYIPKEDSTNRFRLQRDKILKLIGQGTNHEGLHAEFEILVEKIKALPHISDSTYLSMAFIARMIGEEKTTVGGYLNKVHWDKLETISQYDRATERFDRLMARIRYVELRTYLGKDDNLEQLVPYTPSRHEDTYVLVTYLRMVYSLAQLKERAKRDGVTDEVLMKKIESSLQFFSAYKWLGSDDYAYMISEQRGDFLEYAVYAANEYGKEALLKLCPIVEHQIRDYYRTLSTGDLRKMVCALYRCGIDQSWATEMFEQIGKMKNPGQDVYASQLESLEQGKAWVLLGEKERAVQSFRKMIVESFGVEYRKDYQPSAMARWINTVNQQDPKQAVERIHWMTSRLGAIADSTQTNTTSDAGQTLLRGALELNIGMGEQLGEWLCNNRYVGVEFVSSLIVQGLLDKTTTLQDYDEVFRYFTQRHLSKMNPQGDVDTNALDKVYTRGKEIIGGGFDAYIEELERSINDRCFGGLRTSLLNRLEQLEHPEEEMQERISDLTRKADTLLEEAEKLLAQGATRDAWMKGIKSLQNANSYGWDRHYDGGTRIKAIKFLESICAEEGRRIAIQQLADDMPYGASYGVMSNLHEIMQLLVDKVDYMRLYEVEQEYMNRILRADMVNDEDKPKLIFTKTGVSATLRKWVKYDRERAV